MSVTCETSRAAPPADYNPPVWGIPPLPPVDSPARLVLPHSNILHRVTHNRAPFENPYLLGPPPLIRVNDLCLDLHWYAYRLDTGVWPI